MARRNLRRIYTLTADPNGPTGREMDKIAEEIVEVARQKAGDILHNLRDINPDFLSLIQFVRRGDEIRVGIRPDRPAGTDNAGFYLAQKEQREHIWLSPAVAEVMARHPHVTATRGIQTTRIFGKVKTK